jgi:hypothetical protein
MGPYARVYFNLTLCRLQHIYYGQPYAIVDFIAWSWTKNLTFVILTKKGHGNNTVSLFLLFLRPVQAV